MGLRTNSIAVGSRAASTPASCPAPVGSSGASIPRAANAAASQAGQLGVELDLRAERLLPRCHLDPVRAGLLRGHGQDLVHGVLERPALRGADVQPGAHRRADRVGRARLGGHLADRGPRTVFDRGLAGGQHGRRVGNHRIAPVRQRGRTRVVGLPGEVEAPPAVRPDPLGDTKGGIEVGQGPALLDVQLHIAPELREQVLVPADLAGILARRTHRLGQRDPVAVTQFPGLPRVDRAGQQAAAQAGDPEAAPFLLSECGHRDGPGRGEALGPQFVDRREGGHHAQRPVVGTAVRHRVQVAAGSHRGPHRTGDVPPGPEVAVAVRAGTQLPVPGRGLEPRPAVQVGLRPGEPAVPPGARIPPGRQQRLPEGRERRVGGRGTGRAGRHGCIGTRTPRAAATSAASS